MIYGLYACIIVHRKSDAEITFKTSSTQNRVLWDFWQRVKERGRNYKMLYCAPNLLWCPAPCAAPARVQLWPWASPCKYSSCLDHARNFVYCLLFSLSIPAFLLRDRTHLGSGRVVAGVGPLVLRALVAAHAGGLWPLSSAGVGEVRTASSGQNPTCKSAQTLVFMQQDMYLD